MLPLPRIVLSTTSLESSFPRNCIAGTPQGEPKRPNVPMRQPVSKALRDVFQPDRHLRSQVVDTTSIGPMSASMRPLFNAVRLDGIEQARRSRRLQTASKIVEALKSLRRHKPRDILLCETSSDVHQSSPSTHHKTNSSCSTPHSGRVMFSTSVA
jgi:hypothetical protein